MSGTPAVVASGADDLANGPLPRSQASPSLQASGSNAVTTPANAPVAAAPLNGVNPAHSQDIPVPQTGPSRSSLFRAASESSDSAGSAVRQLQGSAPRASTSRSMMQDGGSASKKRVRIDSDNSDLSSLISSDSEEDEAQPLAEGPAYTVERHPTDPNGPHFIRCNRSDGLESNWPTPGPFQDSKGAMCSWEHPTATDKLTQRWYAALGKQIAERLNLQQKAKEDWRLKDFPRGYGLFVHHKGERTDAYLYGSAKVNKFRTVNEFSPHLQMLIENNGQPCACKYCTGAKLQGHVNTQVGIYTDYNRPMSDEALAKRAAKKAKREAKAAKVKVKSESGRTPGMRRSDASSGSAKKLKAPYEGAYVDKDRDRDLAEVACTFRRGEMVWCRLEKPISGGWTQDLVIDYWPAMCESRELFTVAKVVEDPSASNGTNLIRDGQFQPGVAPKLDVKHEFKWKLRLLGINDPLLCTEDHILPWLEYPPTEALFDIPLKPSLLTKAWGTTSTDRVPLEKLVDLPSAITPFALALQIAAHVMSYWNLFERFDLPPLKAMQAAGYEFNDEDKAEYKEDVPLAWFQVLWWGAEKIWSGEMVRLVVGKEDLPEDLRHPSPGSETRCFFLKVTGIYRGKDDRPAIKGPVFELAPLDADGHIPKDEVEYHGKLDARVTNYMPRPPPGFYFRCLSPPSTERHLVLEHIAGRYYPWHQLRVGATVELHPQDTAATEEVTSRSRSLCGLTSGGKLVMKAQNWIANRKEALKMSEKVAETEMEAHFREKGLAQAEQVVGNMDTESAARTVSAVGA